MVLITRSGDKYYRDLLGEARWVILCNGCQTHAAPRGFADQLDMWTLRVSTDSRELAAAPRESVQVIMVAGAEHEASAFSPPGSEGTLVDDHASHRWVRFQIFCLQCGPEKRPARVLQAPWDTVCEQQVDNSQAASHQGVPVLDGRFPRCRKPRQTPRARLRAQR